MSDPQRPPRRQPVALFVALLLGSALVAHAKAPDAAPLDARPRPLVTQQAPSHAVPRIDVVFVLDTTGSMAGLIEGAKQKIWAIASELMNAQPMPEIRVGLVAYRDRGDARTATSG